MIIAVVSQKGGTGKTTIATNLAACYAAQGREVMLVDADPQHSALDWKADRPPTLPPVHALHLPEKNLFQEVQHLRQKYALILIDGGGRITATARAAVAAADFLILPTSPVSSTSSPPRTSSRPSCKRCRRINPWSRAASC